MPNRIQRQTMKGWRKPEGAVYVGPGTRWANPYRIGSTFIGQSAIGNVFLSLTITSQQEAHELYAAALRGEVKPWREHIPTAEDARRALAGRDLMCWCPMGQSCHADVLIEIANRKEGATP